MFQRTISRAVREFIEHQSRTRPVSNKKPLKKNKFFLSEPELDYEYITNPANRQEIEGNIRNRKNIGDINRVLELDEQFRREKCPVKRETLWQSFLAEACILPNKSHPALKDYKEQPRIIKRSEPVLHSFQPKTFLELANDLRLLRTKDLTPVAGPRSYYFIGDLADLEFALIKFTLSRLLKKNFELISVPDILPVEVIQKCGMTPQALQNQVFCLESVQGEENVLSGTAEMALGGMFANAVFNESELPVCATATSRCYRSELSGVTEDKGIFRVHQFTKVEMFGLSLPSQSEELMQKFLNIQEELFSSLELDYQVLDMPMHELGSPAYRKYDIEAWFPGRDMYSEISSCSNCLDYQSRRLNIKYKKGDQLLHVHTLNATACAVPRMIMALFETHQQQNGNVKLPESLRPFMNNKEEIQLQRMTPKLKSKMKESRKSSS